VVNRIGIQVLNFSVYSNCELWCLQHLQEVPNFGD
jgi:hypothetical protein